MFKITLKKIVMLWLVVAFVFGSTACKSFSNNTIGDKPRFDTNYDPNIDSWKQIDPGDEDVTVTWFMDFSYGNNNFEDLVYKRTGVRLNIQTALKNDHQELNTMISGGKLPDIISVENTALRIQLAEEGWCYPINKLAEWYAPSLIPRVSQEHWDYYKGTDGNTYALSSNFYNDADVAEFEAMGGKQYANNGVVVRKDWMLAYIDHMTTEYAKEGKVFDSDKEITKQSGFVAMAEWVKKEFKISNTVPTVTLSPFKTTAINDIFSQTVTGLLEFLNVPPEDENGDLVYQYSTPEFLNLAKFLNEMYRKKLVVSSNFAYDLSDIGTFLANGSTFAYIGADQEIGYYLAKREMAGYDAKTDTVPDSHEYVGIMLTNDAGDTPYLMDFAGRGLYSVMVTGNCKREDRVIKVLDYMMSEQGMRELNYGEIEGEYYNYDLRPGETDPRTGKPSTYGQIVPTDAFKNAVANTYSKNPVQLGIGRLWPLVNSLYLRMTSAHDGFAGIVEPSKWAVYKVKKTYFDHVYSRSLFRYPLDVSDRKALNKYIDRLADVEKVWIEALSDMILADSAEKVEQLYNTALNNSYTKGATEMMEFRNKCFKANKAYLGIDYAWPGVIPDHEDPGVTLYGAADRYASRPEWVYKGAK